MTAKEKRDQRLATQLRANLRRRKAAPVEGTSVGENSEPDQTRDEA